MFTGFSNQIIEFKDIWKCLFGEGASEEAQRHNRYLVHSEKLSGQKARNKVNNYTACSSCRRIRQQSHIRKQKFP